MNKLLFAALVSNVNAVPSSAATDILEDISTNANQAIETFHNNLGKEERVLAGFDDMTEEEQAEFYELQREWQQARMERDEEEYTLVGYTTMSDAAKAAYSTELLAWKESLYEACQEDPTSDTCITKNDMRLFKVTAKNQEIDGETVTVEIDGVDTVVAKRYWDMDPTEKQDFIEAQESDWDQEASRLVAAVVDADKTPDAGARHSSCQVDAEGARQECDKGLCCGLATNGASNKDVCNWGGGSTYVEGAGDDKLTWSFKCIEGAHSIGVAAAATAIAMYLAV